MCAARRASQGTSSGAAIAGVTASVTGTSPAIASRRSRRSFGAVTSSSRHHSVAILPLSPQRSSSSNRSDHSARFVGALCGCVMGKGYSLPLPKSPFFAERDQHSACREAASTLRLRDLGCFGLPVGCPRGGARSRIPSRTCPSAKAEKRHAPPQPRRSCAHAGPGAGNRLENGGEPAGGHGKVVLFLHMPPCRPAEPGPLGRGQDQPPHRGGEGVDIARRDKQAG